MMINNKLKMSTLIGARILVVEDAKLNQVLVKELMQQAGLIVDLAENGESALLLLRKKQYDLVLMDRRMPIMDGVAAAKAIRRDFCAEKLPIVAMSASGGTEEQSVCLTAGMNDYLVKPIDPEELFAALLRWLPSKPDAKQGKARLVEELTGTVDFSGIPGLDFKVGLYHAMNRDNFYAKLLRSFVESQADAIEQIYGALIRGEKALAERTAHSLYGVAATVGALEIAKEAKLLELAISEGQGVWELSLALDKASKILAELVNNISTVLTKENTAPLVNCFQTKKLLKDLEKLLAADLAEAVDTVEAAQGAICAVYGSKGEDLVRTVKNYDFPKALVLVSELLS